LTRSSHCLYKWISEIWHLSSAGRKGAFWRPLLKL
jgi:hypothetical protein